MSFDLAVAWRIYPKVSKAPLIHANNKYQLVKTCIISFLQSVSHLKVKYFMILDGCPDEYVLLIEELLDGNHFEIIRTNGIGNQATFALQVELLLNQKDAEMVYFAEDDYLYAPNEFGAMVDLLKGKDGVDFVTGYFSKDIVNHPIHNYKKNLLWSQGRLWVNCASTCLTFLTSKKILQKTQRIFLTYSRGNNDCALWLVLTKEHIFNIKSYLRFFWNRKIDKDSFNILKMAVKYSGRYFFIPFAFKLWAPASSIAMHLEKDLILEPEKWVSIAETVELINTNTINEYGAG